MFTCEHEDIQCPSSIYDIGRLGSRRTRKDHKSENGTHNLTTEISLKIAFMWHSVRIYISKSELECHTMPQCSVFIVFHKVLHARTTGMNIKVTAPVTRQISDQIFCKILNLIFSGKRKVSGMESAQSNAIR